MRNATIRRRYHDRRRRRLAAAVLAATAVLTVTAPGAFADSAASSAATAKAPAGDGAKGVCKREPKTAKRVERALGRLGGGAETGGSVVRLQRRVDDAKREGHAAIATYLDHRLADRKGLVTTLQQRQKDLKNVASWCEATEPAKK